MSRGVRPRTAPLALALVSCLGNPTGGGTDGEGVRTLVFAADGQLQSATERRTQTIYPANASPTLMEVQLELRFAGDRVITATKRIDNGPGDVRPYEIDRIRRHATAMCRC